MGLIPAIDRAEVDGAEQIVTWPKLKLVDSVPGWLKLGCVLHEIEGLTPLAAYPQLWNGGSKRAIAIVYHVRCILAGAARICAVAILV